MSPSIKSLMSKLKLDKPKAQAIKAIMDGPPIVNGDGRLRRIDKILGTHGVELISAGSGSKSPEINYCNTGDPYTPTIMRVNGQWRIGCWDDIVEKGDYE